MGASNHAYFFSACRIRLGARRPGSMDPPGTPCGLRRVADRDSFPGLGSAQARRFEAYRLSGALWTFGVM